MTVQGSSWAYRVTAVGIDQLSDALDIAGIACAGLTEEDGVTTAWFADRPAAELPVPGRWEEVPDDDWATRWREGLLPVTVGSLTIVPPWLAADGPNLSSDHAILVIEPGMAFGTGHHETTRGCVAALQELDLHGKRVADIGTGTGVLALAAIALGARTVDAVDIDPVAIEVARGNVGAHGVATDGPEARIRLQLGSCEAVPGRVDVVVANIITDLLLPMADRLVSLLAPGGVLLCSGVAAARTAEAVEVFARAGVALQPAGPAREWAVLSGTLRRRENAQGPGSNPGP